MKPKPLSIALGAIEPGPNHRSHFDAEPLKELADSIEQMGVIQPIIVRTIEGKTDGYQLVCGERRYRAAMMVYEKDQTKLTIPAVVYNNLSDQDAMEMQITENLQRADVHAMDEALAFKRLSEIKGYELPEIALRMGKGVKYVGQRMKLTDLIGDIQAAFSADKMDLGLALQLCKFSTEIQVQIYDKEIKKKLPGKIEIEPYTLQDYQGNLAMAAFSLEDTTLNPAMGACLGCQYNTGQNIGNLFPEDAKNARCTLVKCFAGKVKKHFDKELKVAINDGTTALITTEYGRSNSLPEKVKGMKVYSRNDYLNSDLPMRPDIEKYEHDMHYGFQNTQQSREDMLLEFNKDLEKYEKEQKAYDKKVTAGQYQKAFIVAGEGKGKYVFVQLDKKESAAKAKAGDLTAGDIEAEIKRLQEREERNKELDQKKNLEKIHSFMGTFSLEEDAIKHDIKVSVHEPLRYVELRALVILLYNLMGWMRRDDFFEVIGFKDEPSEMEFYEHLKECKDDRLNYYVAILTRECIIQEFMPKKGDRYTDKMEMRCLVDLMEIHSTKDLDEILKEQRDVTEKREGRVNKRISELQAAKLEINKPAGSTAQENAEPGKKKAVKKSTKTHNHANEEKQTNESGAV